VREKQEIKQPSGSRPMQKQASSGSRAPPSPISTSPPPILVVNDKLLGGQFPRQIPLLHIREEAEAHVYQVLNLISLLNSEYVIKSELAQSFVLGWEFWLMAQQSFGKWLNGFGKHLNSALFMLLVTCQCNNPGLDGNADSALWSCINCW
jgi:hypothetical protein